MPTKEEKEGAFISRCMGLVNREFKNIPQRFSVCSNLWKKQKQKE